MSENDLFLSRRLKDNNIKKYMNKPMHYDISPIIKLCPDKYNALNHKLLLMKQIGSGSEYGEAFKSCVPFDQNLNACDKESEIILSTKKIPLSRKQQNDIEDSIATGKNKLNGMQPYEYNDVSMEILGMYLSYVIIMNDQPICPNLPLMYDWFYCDNITYANAKINNKLDINIDYRVLLNNLYTEEFNDSYKSFIKDLQNNKKLVNVDDSIINKFLTTNPVIHDTIRQSLNNKITNSCVLVLNEYADEGDLKNWLLAKHRNEIEWYTMYFQVFAGLYALQKHFDLLHYDLHWGNVLVHNIKNLKNLKNFNSKKDSSYMLYKIDNNFYRIPNTGYLFTLWDFGFARIFSKKLHAKEEYQRDSYNMNPYSEDYYRISQAVFWYQGGNGPSKPTGKETKRAIHGTTPTILTKIFYKTILNAYKNKTPLEKLFPMLFSRFQITEDRYNQLKDLAFTPYTIDDTTIPSAPQEIRNTTNHYREYITVNQLNDKLTPILDNNNAMQVSQSLGDQMQISQTFE